MIKKTTNSTKIDYLRLSLTDRCNLRCIYCWPKNGIIRKAQHEVLSYEEILRLAKIFVSLGIKKIRLTGGEPLVRKGVIYLANALVKTKGLKEVVLTTNGMLLPAYAQALKRAGIQRLNISLNTLNRARFESISGSDYIDRVFAGIAQAKSVGFKPIKLNTVIMKGVNDDELIDFVEYAISNGLILRFIEFMQVTPLWREQYFISIEEIKKVCQKRFRLKKKGNLGCSPAEYYQIDDNAVLGFIKTDENNCRKCNRLRLSSTGELKICLYQDKGVSIKELLRTGATDAEIKDLLTAKMAAKKYTDYRTYERAGTYMCNIGG
ncbi:GTP 3',8-cyclase MoaA [Candidatus Omnitrophota bacterium]